MLYVLEEIPLGQTAEDTGGLKDGKVKVAARQLLWHLLSGVKTGFT